MVRNNIEIDVKTKCIEEGITQTTLAERVDTSAQYVNKVMKKPDGVVNKTFVTMMEKLGYDIRLTYIKREV
jgi:predicted XRE-type DNA-binding protein